MKKKFFSLFKNVRFLIVLIFMVSFFLMSYGYAVFNTDEHLYGLGSISKYGKVYISNIQMISAEFINATGSIQEYSDTSATLPVAASDKIFSATYLVTITNSMVIDQVLAGVTVDPQVTSGSATVDNYVEMTDYATGNKVYPGLTLSAQSDTVLKVKIYYTSDEVTTISTDFGIIVIDDADSGTLSKGTIDRTTGSFDDNKTPECYTVSFMNSYSYDAVVGITTTTGYDILNTNGGPFGNVTIPANSTTSITYCIKPTITMTNTSVTLPITYQSYNTGQTFSDTIALTLTTNHKTFTIATNFSDGIIKCDNLTTGQYSFISTTGSGSYAVTAGDQVKCTVGDGNDDYHYYDGSDYSEYYSQTWTITNDSSTYNKTVELVEKPWITGTYAYNHVDGEDEYEIAFYTTPTTGTLTNYRAGYYLVEMWGGSGSHGYNYANGFGGPGGTAGHIYGVIYLGYKDSIYYTIGGNGTEGRLSSWMVNAGGANGGGNAEDGNSWTGGSGGGYTALYKGTSTSGTLAMLAGGSGGGGGAGGLMGGYDNELKNHGGDGGTNSSTATSVSGGVVFAGTDGDSKKVGKYAGTGGSTTGGYCSLNQSDTSGSYLTGGNAVERGGGGGAGYYGGGGGATGNGSGVSSSGYYTGGGGGGSSFISNSVTYSGLSSTITSKLTNTNVSVDVGGSVIISYVGKTLN